jgi:putative transposase
MTWARMPAYITRTVDQELLLRNEYLAAENRILKAQIKTRLLLFALRRLHSPRSVVDSAARLSRK